MSKTKNLNADVKFGSLRRRLMLAFIILSVLDIVLSVAAIQINRPTVSLIFLAVGVVFILVYGFFLSANICKPLKNIYSTMHELRMGHLDARCNYRANNDIGHMSQELDLLAAEIKDNIIGVISRISDGDVTMNVESKGAGDMVTPELKKIVTCMRSLSHDTERLISAVASGNLNERGYTASYKGSWKYLIEGINTLIDKISTPISDVIEVTRSLAVNDFTHSIKEGYEGSFNELASHVNEVRDNLLAMQGAVVRVSMGDTGKLEEFEAVGKKSENDYMVPSLVKMMRTIRELIAEIKVLTEEASKGSITNTRGDASKFEGGYKTIIEGVNNTLDTIVKPVAETTSVLDALAVNDYTVKPDSTVMIGDFKHLGDAIHQVQTNVNTIQTTTVQISVGDISALEQLEAMGKLSENDQLIPAFTKMMHSIGGLMTETTALANAAIEGRLEYRSDTASFEGEFANILKSFNRAFHYMANPVNEISEVMEQIAAGNLGTSVTGDYKGAFGRLAQVVNGTSSTIGEIAGKISFVLTNIAQGNLDLEKVEDYRGDFASISSGLNTIVDSLNDLLSNISISTDQVASGAKQVSEGSQNLSHGATEQASSVEQLTSSISEISAQTKNNAESANEANTLAKTTKENAVVGNSQMKEMLTAMNDINESSSNISKIIKVIDDIAFQTNILALNAAVEAARAGQYGKGFAVVAEEVRNLAARSAGAAKDTTNLIEGSVKKIESGTQIANDTATALSSIVDSVDKVSNLVSDIAAASNEQATGISQIDRGVEVVSNVVQTNSATAEQSAAASEELSSQAEYLREMLAKFKFRRNA